MMRGGSGGGKREEDLGEPTAPLPVEAEEASAQLKYGQLIALLFGIVFLAILADMAYTVATTPGFPYLIPSLAMAFFGIGGVVDISLAATSRSGAVHLWHQSKFEESDHFLRGWRMTLGFVPGGVLPGWFIHRALQRVHPLVQLELGIAPPSAGIMSAGSGGMGAPAAGPTMSPMMSSGAPGAGPGSGYADSVAPDPFGSSRRGSLPPPTSSPMPSSTPASLWTRPNIASSAPPASSSGSPRLCPACQTPQDADSRFCKSCGTAVPP